MAIWTSSWRSQLRWLLLEYRAADGMDRAPPLFPWAQANPRFWLELKAEEGGSLRRAVDH